ncbi:MAG TPA: hypothetical protein VKA95_03915 [Nitrososphaeraceae archaeon]|nr:hypothetical protein [Nitrososphaeraceae archaeon]
MSFDLLRALKKAEPLGFLASLSLVISTFTFDGVGNIYKIYSYSVVSAFMFIFSFVSSIFNQYFMSVESNNSIISSMRVVTNFGIYFFLIIGLIFLSLIAYQFGQSQTQISIITGAFFGSFVFIMGIWVLVKRLKKAIEQRGKISFSAMADIGMSVIGILVVATFIIIIVEAIFEIEDLTKNYLKLMFIFIGPLLGFYIGTLLLLYLIDIIRVGKRSLDKFDCVLIIFFSAVAIFFFMGSLYYLVNS